MEPTTIRIPDTIDEAMSRLGGIERLLTARGWERAAIVYAFTHEPGPGGDRRSQGRNQRVKTHADSPLTCKQFADLGVQGLRGNQAVYEHRRAWQEAIDTGEAVAPQPGETVALPTSDFPVIQRGRGLVGSFAQDRPVEVKYDAVKEIIRREPEVAERLLNDHIQEIGRSPALASRVDRVYEEHHPVPDMRHKPVSDIERLQVFDFAGGIYSSIQRYNPDLNRAIRYLEERRELDDLDRTSFEYARETLAKAKAMIDQMDDHLCRAGGVSSDDETFRRLVSQ